MSYSYYLEMASEESPSAILAILSRRDRFEMEEKQGGLIGPGLWIVAWRPEKEDVDLTENHLGFRPKVEVSFRHSSYDPAERPYNEMIAATLALLEVVEGDAVLRSEGPKVLLQRRKGQIFINTEWEDNGRLREAVPTGRPKAFEDL